MLKFKLGCYKRAREGPSSEAEIGHPLEGDADGPHAGLRRVLPFPLNGKQAVGLRGFSRLIRCLCFFLKKAVLVPQLGTP